MPLKVFAEVKMFAADSLAYLASAIETSGTFSAPVPISLFAALPRPRPEAFSPCTDTPSQKT